MLEASQVLGVNVHRVTQAALSERLDYMVLDGRPHQVVTVNTDFLRIAKGDRQFRDFINGADLVLADGAPVVWLARLGGQPLPERVTGLDLIEAGSALASAHGYRIFLLGAGPGVAEAAGRALEARHPGLRIAGSLSPPCRPFTAEDDEDIAIKVRSAEPQMLFVALGAPRQDVWIREHMAALCVPVSAGVGGAFDLIAGRLPRAPRWVQSVGLEWAYRLKREPSRLWRRYLIGDLPYLARAVGVSLVSRAGQRNLGRDRRRSEPR
jgi:N-acetylglucosaminyldiphosphoundecaprenol N-acetyl-beta-D-mannosaminyltransferase